MESRYIFDGEAVATNLRLLRATAGKTKSDIGKDLGISLVTLSQYEQDAKNIPLRIAVEFANYFQLSVEDILNPNLIQIGVRHE